MPPQCILQDRHLASLIFVFVYFKVGPNLKYSVKNILFNFYFIFILYFVFNKKEKRERT